LTTIQQPRVISVVSAPFEENAYIAYFDGRSDCLVLDPGFEPEKILGVLEQLDRKPALILNTHGHSDHIAGNEAMKSRWPDCPLVIGRRDEPKLSDPRQNLSAPFGFRITSPAADRLVDEGDVIEAAGFEFLVREIPGHSIGHVVFIHAASEPTVVFGGDVLFRGSVGRTDFPDGDFEQLAHGIRAKLFTLPDDTLVYPGHGPPTTVGEEKRNNPFVGSGAE